MAGNTCLMKISRACSACAAAIADRSRAHRKVSSKTCRWTPPDPTAKWIRAGSLHRWSVSIVSAATAAAQMLNPPAQSNWAARDPGLALADADLDAAAEVLALSRIINAGQS